MRHRPPLFRRSRPGTSLNIIRLRTHRGRPIIPHRCTWCNIRNSWLAPCLFHAKFAFIVYIIIQNLKMNYPGSELITERKLNLSYLRNSNWDRIAWYIYPGEISLTQVCVPVSSASFWWSSADCQQASGPPSGEKLLVSGPRPKLPTVPAPSFQESPVPQPRTSPNLKLNNVGD